MELAKNRSKFLDDYAVRPVGVNSPFIRIDQRLLGLGSSDGIFAALGAYKEGIPVQLYVYWSGNIDGVPMNTGSMAYVWFVNSRKMVIAAPGSMVEVKEYMYFVEVSGGGFKLMKLPNRMVGRAIADAIRFSQGAICDPMCEFRLYLRITSNLDILGIKEPLL